MYGQTLGSPTIQGEHKVRPYEKKRLMANWYEKGLGKSWPKRPRVPQ
jgi:hypothetical protein